MSEEPENPGRKRWHRAVTFLVVVCYALIVTLMVWRRLQPIAAMALSALIFVGWLIYLARRRWV